MYIGHLFGPLHCKFATFMANDNARSAIFYWLALCRMVWAAVRAEECTAVRCPMQRAALAGAAHCVGQCSALRAGGLPCAGRDTPRLCGGGMRLGHVFQSCERRARKGLLGRLCHSVLLVAGRLWNPLTAPCARAEKQRRGQPVCCLRLGVWWCGARLAPWVLFACRLESHLGGLGEHELAGGLVVVGYHAVPDGVLHRRLE